MAIIREDKGDASQTTETQYAITLGDVFQGEFESAIDTDWIRIEPSAGKILDIRIVTDGMSVEMQLLDSEGNHITYGSLWADEGFIISPAVGEIFYIDIYNPSDDYIGEYEVSIVENTIPIGTYEELAAYMTDGFWKWRNEGGSGAAFDVSSGGILTANISALNENAQQGARWALETWSNVTGIAFQFVNGDNADIAFEYYEGTTASGGYSSSNGVITAGYVNIPQDAFPMGATTVDVGDIFAFIHEIGHALGLGHPGPYPKDPYNTPTLYSIDNLFLIDSGQSTVMSYFHQSTNTYINASTAIPVTPMIADIIAIQNLYGIPTDTHIGNTVYGYQSNLDGYLGHFFAAWTGEQNPLASITSGPHSAPEFGDLDGDNDLDLIVGNQNGRIDYYENIGTVTNPIFIQRTDILNPLVEINVDFTSSPALADLDGDGDMDLIVGNLIGSINYYENEGTVNQPDFVQRSGMNNPLEDIDVDSICAPALADLDADGDLDLVIGSQFNGIHYFENTGSANSPDYTQRSGDANPLGGIERDFFSTPTLSDLDGDNDLDLIVGYQSGSIEYHENTGTVTSPSFALRSDTANLLQDVASWFLSNPVLTDLDGDGDYDLIFGNDMPTMQYYENIGSVLNPLFTGRSVAVPTTLTLYDTGGNDTLDLRTDHQDQRVDLHPEGISDVYGLVGNLVIARDTVIENFIAGSGNDVVTGNTAANSLEGRIGNDTLDGLAGGDTLYGDSGSDTLNGGDDDDHLHGGAGADMLDGGPGEDYAYYLDSPVGVLVRLHNAGAVRYGDAEGDTLTGIEHLVGSEYNDTLAGDGEDNILEGRNGDDVLYGGPAGGDDRMYGGNGDDRVFGGKGNDTLTGGEGNDVLKGGPGEDTLIVDGDDMDVLYGGPDQDTFRFFPSDLGGGSIRDFSDGEDMIDLTEFTGISSMDDLEIVSHGDNVLIELSGTDYSTTIILTDFDVSNLDATDFLF